jgi:hypothetical protein
MAATGLRAVEEAAGSRGSPPGSAIYPAPMEREDGGENFALTANTSLVLTDEKNAELQKSTALLREEMKAYGGFEMPVKGGQEANGAQNGILLGILPGSKLLEDRLKALKLEPVNKPEGYVLSIGKDGALIAGSDARGTYYGVLTLLQRLHKDKDGQVLLAGTRIRDWPHFAYRGMRLGLPRGKPKEGEIDKAYFKNFLRVLSLLKMNYVQIEGFPWAVPLQRRPGLNWPDVLTRDEIKEIDDCGSQHFLRLCPTIASAPCGWGVNKFPQLYEVNPGEDPRNMKTWGYRKGKPANRQNLCPSNEETYKLLFDIYDEIIPMFNGDIFNVGIDEVHHESAGGRWCACEKCKDKDPAKLFAEFANKLCEHVLAQGKLPIVNSTVLIKEHGGSFKDLYKSAALINKKAIISNWSETHIRKKVPDFKATPYFKDLGYEKIIHLVSAGKNWDDRLELKEVKGKLDAFGVVVAHYAGMKFETLNQNGTIYELVFSAENAWSPDLPAIGSEDERRQMAYANTLLREVLLNGKRFMEAIEAARAKPQAPGGKGEAAEFR